MNKSLIGFFLLISVSAFAQSTPVNRIEVSGPNISGCIGKIQVMTSRLLNENIPVTYARCRENENGTVTTILEFSSNRVYLEQQDKLYVGVCSQVNLYAKERIEKNADVSEILLNECINNNDDVYDYSSVVYFIKR